MCDRVFARVQYRDGLLKIRRTHNKKKILNKQLVKAKTEIEIGERMEQTK